jgi:leader peptidase (prepilin peptidase)/N-methyltransferase
VRVALFAVLGLILGSFLTVVIHRVPRKESIVRPGSACPRCGTPIRWFENIPVGSWLALRGRCRHCGERISAQYPLLEAGTMLLFAVAALLVEPVEAAGLVAPFLGLMLALALIDARHKVVPNAITYPAVALFAVAIGVVQALGGGVDLLRGAIGMAAYALPIAAIAVLYPAGMGLGDAKLAALIGLVIGSVSLASVAVAAGLGILAGGVGAIVAVAVLRLGRKAQVPYGPYLAGGAVVAALGGPAISRAYLSLFSI